MCNKISGPAATFISCSLEISTKGRARRNAQNTRVNFAIYEEMFDWPKVKFFLNLLLLNVGNISGARGSTCLVYLVKYAQFSAVYVCTMCLSWAKNIHSSLCFK